VVLLYRLIASRSSTSSNLVVADENLLVIMNSSPFEAVCDKTSQEERILREEVALLKVPGPSLSILNELGERTTLFELESHENSHCVVRVLQDINSNIRMFYYALLSACFDSRLQGSEHSLRILANLKSLVYPESLRLDRFNPEEVPQQYRLCYTNRTLKKILVEFLHVIQYSEGDIAGTINRYPIIDLVMVTVVRALVGSNTIRYAAVQTELLANYF